MTTPGTRACLLLLVGGLAVSTGSGQPPEAPKNLKIVPTKWSRPDYTAFPDLKPPTSERKEVKKADGTTVIVVEEKGVVPLPEIPALAADAPPLRKVRFEQLHAGLSCLARMKAAFDIGHYTPSDFQDYITTAVDTYRVAAELEDKPAKRIPWYEARIRKLKEFEQFTSLRVNNGTAGPRALDLARFQRLEAEAELLKLKEEVEKPGK